jgi:glycosyltransferase involved in cell wall biosynthesis
MRILTLTNLYPNPFQPQRATFNREQIRLLGERCHVRIIAPIAWTDELAARRKGSPPLPPGRNASLDGLKVDYPLYLFPPKMLRSRYGQFYRTSVRRSFARALDEFHPDLIYSPWAYPDGWAAVALGHEAGLPVVIKVHGSDVLRMDHYSGRSRPTVEALQRADSVLAVSGDLARRIQDHGVDPARVHVHYDGIDRNLFCPGSAAKARGRLGLDPDTPAILTIGNLVPVKGQDLLIEACAKLARDGVNFVCYVIGQGPLRTMLERLAAGLGLAERFRFVGSLPHERLPDWYRAASVFALPSHSEGVPTVLLEAAGCGTPFVASRVGGIPEIAHIGPCRLVPPRDVDALAQGLRTYLTATEDRDPRKVNAVRSRLDAVDELERFFQKTIRTHGCSNAVPCQSSVQRLIQATDNSIMI